MKNNVTTFSVAIVLALSFMACQDEPDVLSGRYPGKELSKESSAQYQLANLKQTEGSRNHKSLVKSGYIGEQELHQIHEALNSLDDPSLYRFEIVRNGKVVDYSGSAALSDLQTSAVYYSDEFSKVLLSEMICPELFPNIFRAIWTGIGRVPFSEKYQDQVATVEKIIDHTAVSTIDMGVVELGSAELRSMKKVLAGADPSAYRIEVYENGRVTGSMGSAALTDLRQSGAYYGGSGGKIAQLLDYDICPPWVNIIRGIWTGGPLGNEEIAGHVEEMLNQAAIH